MPKNIVNSTVEKNRNNCQNKSIDSKFSEQKNYCLLKFCGEGLYNKLRDRKYILPSNTEKIKGIIDRFFYETTAHPNACAICDILGSGKSAILNQVLKELKTKRFKKKNIYYIDVYNNSMDLWKEYNTNKEIYEEQPNGNRCNLLEKYLFEELKKARSSKKLLGNTTNFQQLIDRLEKAPKRMFRKKQIIIIDNLDNLLNEIFSELTNLGEITNENIECLQGIKTHIEKLYLNIGSLHSKLKKKNFGGCLTVVRPGNGLPNNLLIESNAFWTKDILTDIFIYYVAKGKTNDNECTYAQCKYCKYRVTSEEFEFCKNFKTHSRLKGKNKNIYISIQQKIEQNLQLSDNNLKRFLYPFAHLNKEWCVNCKDENNGEDFINNQIKGYYKKQLPDPNDNAMREDSIFNTYFRIFSIDYGEKGDNLLEKCESFITTIIENNYRTRLKKDWIKQILKSILQNDESKKDTAVLIFNCLRNNRILVDITPKEKEEKKEFGISDFFKFIYGREKLFLNDKEGNNAR